MVQIHAKISSVNLDSLPVCRQKSLTRKMKQTFLVLLVNLTFIYAEVTHHVHNLVYNTHIQQNLDDCGYYGDRF